LYYTLLGKDNPINKIKDLITNNALGWTDELYTEFNKVLLDTKHYGSPEELKEALGIDDEAFNAIESLLETYYANISTNYKN